jgi:mannose-6-phosphate isomerase
MELRCSIQQYAWGKCGRSSEVALLHSSSNPAFTIDEAVPYAELWMGTHPNGASVLKGSGQELGLWIQTHPTSLGAKVTEKFGVQLPFLFKVLSVNQALSVQAHPDKVFHQAIELR